jgi:hypothetical protein
MWIYLLIAVKANTTYLFKGYTSLQHCEKVEKVINEDNHYNLTSCEEIWIVKEDKKP